MYIKTYIHELSACYVIGCERLNKIVISLFLLDACTLYSAQYTVYIVHCTIYSIHCTLCNNVYCTVIIYILFLFKFI